jgi:hypothetical protein
LIFGNGFGAGSAMSVLEFLYFTFYLLFLIANIIAIQTLNPSAMMRNQPAIEDTAETNVDAEEKPELQEPENSKQDNTMTENPILSNRKEEDRTEEEASSPHELPKVEKVD